MDRLEKQLANLEKEVRRLGSLKFSLRAIGIKIVDKEGEKVVKKWARKCGREDRKYCMGILESLVRYYTPESIDRLLTEALNRGRDIKELLDLLRDCRPSSCDWDMVRVLLAL